MGNTFSQMLQTTETGTWTTGGQQQTYQKKQQHKTDNAMVQNNTQIVLGYQPKKSLNCV